MMERLLVPQVRRAVGLAAVGDKDCSNLTDAEYQVVEQLVQLMAPFEQVTRRMGGQRYLSISSTYRFIIGLRKHCARLVDDVKLCDPVRQAAQDLDAKMKARFDAIPPVVQWAMALDPRGKALNCFTKEYKEKVYASLAVQCSLVDLPDPPAADVAPPAAKKPRVDNSDYDVLQMLGVADAPAAEAAENSWEAEFQAWMTEPELGPALQSSADALAWWKRKAEVYPRLSFIARRVLCIPATSCPAERLFSAAGNIVTAKRTALGDHLVDALCTLHGNRQYLSKIPMPAKQAKKKADQEEKKQA
jgi:hypothetical protein